MIYVEQYQINDAPAVCSRNNVWTGATQYLWSVTHKLSNRVYRFIPYRIPPSVTYEPGYDLFNFNIDDSIPESLTGNTLNTTNVHLIPGEYYIKIYAQVPNNNLNPALSDGVVYENMMTVNGIEQNNPTTYSGTSDVFIMYNENNIP